VVVVVIIVVVVVAAVLVLLIVNWYRKAHDNNGWPGCCLTTFSSSRANRPGPNAMRNEAENESRVDMIKSGIDGNILLLPVVSCGGRGLFEHCVGLMQNK
jgi:uncharacterized membrane protein YqiK